MINLIDQSLLKAPMSCEGETAKSRRDELMAFKIDGKP